MDREWLSGRITDGWSIAANARATRRDPSTVGYWVNKYGLVSAHSARRPTRGGVDEVLLRALVERALSVRQIATELDRSPGTVRYWLRRYGLHTRPARYASRHDRPEGVVRECSTHGWTTFRPVGRGGRLRCPRCMSESVATRRRRLKEILVADAGGRCAMCHYDRCLGALQFHHRDRAQKQFQLGSGGLTRSLERLRKEAKKCVLLCANCHAEVEAGLVAADALPG